MNEKDYLLITKQRAVTMSNFKCSECGTVNVDCGKEGYKTPREIELEKENERLKGKLKIAEAFIEFLANGKCSSDVCKLQNREYKNCLSCFENKAQEALQKMEEVK